MPGPQPRCAAGELPNGRPAELLSQLVGSGEQQGPHLVEGLDPGVASGAIGGAKRPDCLDISVPGLWFGDGATEKDRLGRRDSVNRIRLAVARSEEHTSELQSLR